MKKNIQIKFSHKQNGDLIFNGYWKGQPFMALYKDTEIDYGWSPVSYLPNIDKKCCGVYDYDHDEYDDIQEALEELTIRQIIKNN